MNLSTKSIVMAALKEDRAWEDITSLSLVSSKITLTANIIAKQAGILCGTSFAREAFKIMDRDCKVTLHRKDGDRIAPNIKVITIRGSALKILAAERTALNFLQHCSGIATLTNKYVSAVKGTKAKIYDTRKTIPGIRALQKYSVLCGGGRNHRMNLKEFALVKDTTLSAIDWNRKALLSMKERLPKYATLEIEVNIVPEIQLALDAHADIILLDNWNISKLKKATDFIRSHFISGKRKRHCPLIETSGGITLKNVRKIARSGVDRISIGALTHSAPALDLSMEVLSVKR